jgi:hypothetical protein
MFIAIAVFGWQRLRLSRWLPLSLFLVVLGAADMVNVVVRSSLIQLSTPDNMRGRVGAVNAMFIGVSSASSIGPRRLVGWCGRIGGAGRRRHAHFRRAGTACISGARPDRPS